MIFSLTLKTFQFEEVGVVFPGGGYDFLGNPPPRGGRISRGGGFTFTPVFLPPIWRKHDFQMDELCHVYTVCPNFAVTSKPIQKLSRLQTKKKRNSFCKTCFSGQLNL